MTTLLEHNMEIWHNKVAEQGRAEGYAEGGRKLLLRWATSLFGADTAARLEILLSRIDDPEQLAEIGEVLIRCDTGEELLSRITRNPE